MNPAPWVERDFKVAANDALLRLLEATPADGLKLAMVPNIRVRPDEQPAVIPRRRNAHNI